MKSDTPAKLASHSVVGTHRSRSPAGADGAARNLLLALRNVSQSDIAAKGSFSYDFFPREFDFEELKRKEIMEFLDKALEMIK